jgi:endonuclease YncB( thermonuclease family)
MSAARLVRVVDGDTIVVRRFGLLGYYNQTIRLYGIDAPEMNQPGGLAATQALRKFLSSGIPRGTVYLTYRGVGYYGRTLADVSIRKYCPTLANPFRICYNDSARFLVRRGFAWAIKSYGASPGLLALWRIARLGRAGLWRRRRRPVRPSVWRRNRRRRRRIRSKVEPLNDDKTVEMLLCSVL